MCLHAFTVSIAREQGTGKSVRGEGGGGVEGLVAPLGPKKGAVRGEGEKSHLGWISRQDRVSERRAEV